MSKPETMMIDDVKYVRADKVNEPNGPIKIAILQRGWVMVGRFERNGSDCKLHNAHVIRIWGTSKGLGEIAGNGPIKDKTILDKCYGVVEFDYLTVVALISVEESKWLSVI
jgi:hypothetical protein